MRGPIVKWTIPICILLVGAGCGIQADEPLNTITNDNSDRTLCKDIAEHKRDQIRGVSALYMPVDQELVDVVPIRCGGAIKLSIRADSSADFAKIGSLYVGLLDRDRGERASAASANFSGRIYYNGGTASISVTRITNEHVQPRPF